MAKATKAVRQTLIIPDEVVINKILVLRDKKIMIDKDIAELYGVTTKRLNEQVKRNKKDSLQILCSSLHGKRKTRWSQIATTSKT